MAAHKGQISNPNGRPKGVPNRQTLLARDAIAAFVDGNAHRLAEWLDAIAADNPKDAFSAFMSVVEYHIPRLARSEIKADISLGFANQLAEAERIAGILPPPDAVAEVIVDAVIVPDDA